jgi:mRNA interferase MazF
MADKINTLPKAKMGRRIGRLDDADMPRLNRAVILFLGLASTSAQQPR